RKANMPTRVTIELIENARLRNRSSRSSGAGERRSAMMNSGKTTTATTQPAITHGFDQPLLAPWMTAKSSANSDTAIVTWPGMSSDRPSGDEEFCAAKATRVVTSARAATTRNAQRQDAVGSLPH